MELAIRAMKRAIGVIEFSMSEDAASNDSVPTINALKEAIAEAELKTGDEPPMSPANENEEDDMSDRKLLALAAKAAGYRIDWPASKYMVQGYTFDSLLRFNELSGHSVWNPLTNNEDAVRLAVKLGMVYVSDLSEDCIAEYARSKRDDNPETRRAIVKAAVKMWKALGARHPMNEQT